MIVDYRIFDADKNPLTERKSYDASNIGLVDADDAATVVLIDATRLSSFAKIFGEDNCERTVFVEIYTPEQFKGRHKLAASVDITVDADLLESEPLE